MDWDLAIKRNSEALREIIAGLFAMLELAGGITVSRIPQSLHSAVRRVLWPAESAVRRLIVIAARGLVVKLPPRVRSRVPSRWEQSGKAGAQRLLLPALRYAEEFPGVAPTPRKIREKSATYPFLRRQFPGGRPVAVTPARSRSSAL